MKILRSIILLLAVIAMSFGQANAQCCGAPISGFSVIPQCPEGSMLIVQNGKWACFDTAGVFAATLPSCPTGSILVSDGAGGYNCQVISLVLNTGLADTDGDTKVFSEEGTGVNGGDKLINQVDGIQVGYIEIQADGAPKHTLIGDLDPRRLTLTNLTTAQRNVLPNQQAGDLIYNSDNNCFEWYNGTVWDCIPSLTSFQNLQTAINTHIAADLDTDATNELQDTSNIPGLSQYVQNQIAGSTVINQTTLDSIQAVQAAVNTHIAADLDTDATNELQDTTNIPGLSQYVQNQIAGSTVINQATLDSIQAVQAAVNTHIAADLDTDATNEIDSFIMPDGTVLYSGDTIQNEAPFIPSEIIFTSTADPNSASTICYTDPDDISGTTIPCADNSVLYAATDGTSWIFDGTDYVTYSAPEATEWNLAGTSTDAGSDKTSPISRTGRVNTGRNYTNAAVQLSSYNEYDGKNNYGALFLSRPTGTAGGVAIGSYSQVYTDATGRTQGYGARNDVIARTGATFSSNVFGTYTNATVQSGASVGTTAGIYASNNMAGSSTGSSYGIFANVTGAGTRTGAVLGADIRATPSGSVSSNIYGIISRANPTGSIGGAAYGHYLQLNPSAAATVTGAMYGLFVTGNNWNTTSASRFAIYEGAIGATKNYFRNDVGLNTTAPTAQLSVNGTANKTGGGAWDVFSDRRIKKNINTYTGGLKELVKINPVEYEYSDDYLNHLSKDENGLVDVSRIKHIKDKKIVGIIAQEIQKVLPNTVKVNPDLYDDQLEFDQNELIFTMLNAIKELSKKVEELEQK